MQFKNDDVEGKSKQRWFKGVWVTIDPRNGGHIVLTSGGYEVVRSVSRLLEEERWSAERLMSVNGLPWSRRHGAVKTTPAERSAPQGVSAPGVAIHLASDAKPAGGAPEFKRKVRLYKKNPVEAAAQIQ